MPIDPEVVAERQKLVRIAEASALPPPAAVPGRDQRLIWDRSGADPGLIWN
jgi:hypothetical protein